MESNTIPPYKESNTISPYKESNTIPPPIEKVIQFLPL